MNVTKGFIAEENDLEFYNGRALLNLEMEFVYCDDDGNELPFGFSGYTSSYFRVYNDDRREELVKSFVSQLTLNGNVIYFNCSVNDMTFEDQGPYYFEMGYNQSGYEVPVRFGRLRMV